jgi:hypothetical protein
MTGVTPLTWATEQPGRARHRHIGDSGPVPRYRSGHLQVGGYADQEDSDPDPLERLASSAVREAKLGRWGNGEPVSGAVEDWVLLAHWNPDIRGREGADVQWGIQWADLEARRFDRTFSTVSWNP